jgi:hypothetical protein
MTTAKQQAANRQNARKSTGPKTPKGKAVVALNALKHGLLSRHVHLADEDEAALVELGKRLRAHLQPVGEFEVLLVDRMVTAVWRLRRLHAVETHVFAKPNRFSPQAPAQVGEAFQTGMQTFAMLSRYETTIERGLYKALHELQRLQAARAGVPVPPPAAADVDVNVTVQDSGEDLS